MDQAKRGQFAAERWTIRLAPALGMAAIAASALLMTESEARWAQVFAGPTDQPGPITWRVAVKRGTFGRPLPSSAQLKLRAVFGASAEINRLVSVDDTGTAWITFERPADAAPGPITTTLSEGQRVLAMGSVTVPKERWLVGQRNEGGWCTGRHEGIADIRVGVVDGIVLHTFASRVVIAVSKNGQPLPRQPVTIQADGVDILGGSDRHRIDTVTDAKGLAYLTVQLTDMAATVNVSAHNVASFFGALPIRAGGLRVDRRDDSLIVRSSVGHEQATVGLLTEAGLVDVRTVQLRRTGDTSTATLNYQQWPASPFWAMVSSEPELDAGNTIGWPIVDSTASAQAHASYVVPNLLALDGYRTVAKRLDQQRHRAWMTSIMALLLLALLMAWAIIRSNHRQQRQMLRVNQWLSGDGPIDVSDHTPYALIAVVVVTAATVTIAWWTAIGR